MLGTGETMRRRSDMLSPDAPGAAPSLDLPAADSASTDPDYRRALNVLYAYSALPRSPEEQRRDRPRKLPRMRCLLDLLGRPQLQFPSVLIAGTKGKGSTAALLTSILTATGTRVGRYTQPH